MHKANFRTAHLRGNNFSTVYHTDVPSIGTISSKSVRKFACLSIHSSVVIQAAMLTSPETHEISSSAIVYSLYLESVVDLLWNLSMKTRCADNDMKKSFESTHDYLSFPVQRNPLEESKIMFNPSFLWRCRFFCNRNIAICVTKLFLTAYIKIHGGILIEWSAK